MNVPTITPATSTPPERWGWCWHPEYPKNSATRRGAASSREEAKKRLREDQDLWNAQHPRTGKADY